MMAQLRTAALLFVNPIRAFEEVKARPRVWLVLLLVILPSLLLGWLATDRIDTFAMQRVTAAKIAAEDPRADVYDSQVEEQARRAVNVRRLGAVATALVALPVLFALLAALIWVAFTAWSEGFGYRRCYALVVHAWLPFALRQLLALPVLATYPAIDPASDKPLFATDLAHLAGLTDVPGLSLVDPFWLWMGVLVGLGGVVMGKGRLRSTLVGLLFALACAGLSRALPL